MAEDKDLGGATESEDVEGHAWDTAGPVPPDRGDDGEDEVEGHAWDTAGPVPPD